MDPSVRAHGRRSGACTFQRWPEVPEHPVLYSSSRCGRKLHLRKPPSFRRRAARSWELLRPEPAGSRSPRLTLLSLPARPDRRSAPLLAPPIHPAPVAASFQLVAAAPLRSQPTDWLSLGCLVREPTGGRPITYWGIIPQGARC